MKKHLNRLALLIGLILLAMAIIVMMSQTIGHKKAGSNSSTLPISIHRILTISS